jgi:hypothetical protein
MLDVGSQYVVDQGLGAPALGTALEPFEDFGIDSDADLLGSRSSPDQFGILEEFLIQRWDIGIVHIFVRAFRGISSAVYSSTSISELSDLER